jgi:hypothetical protein
MSFLEYFIGIQQRFGQQAYQFVLLLITSDGLVRQLEEQHAWTRTEKVFRGTPRMNT